MTERPIDIPAQIDRYDDDLRVQRMLFTASEDEHIAAAIDMTRQILVDVRTYVHTLEAALRATQDVVDSKQAIIDIMERRIAELTTPEAV